MHVESTDKEQTSYSGKFPVGCCLKKMGLLSALRVDQSEERIFYKFCQLITVVVVIMRHIIPSSM